MSARHSDLIVLEPGRRGVFGFLSSLHRQAHRPTNNIPPTPTNFALKAVGLGDSPEAARKLKHSWSPGKGEPGKV